MGPPLPIALNFKHSYTPPLFHVENIRVNLPEFPAVNFKIYHFILEFSTFLHWLPWKSSFFPQVLAYLSGIPATSILTPEIFHWYSQQGAISKKSNALPSYEITKEVIKEINPAKILQKFITTPRFPSPLTKTVCNKSLNKCIKIKDFNTLIYCLNKSLIIQINRYIGLYLYISTTSKHRSFGLWRKSFMRTTFWWKRFLYLIFKILKSICKSQVQKF